MTDVSPIPEGFHSVTPYLLIDGAAAAIEFYKEAFGAEETVRLAAPDGNITHAEIRIGDSHVMLADCPPDRKSPKKLGDSPVMMHLYVPDVDAVFAQAVKAGATVERPVTDKFYGDRNGDLIDPFGHRWGVSTHKEDLSLEEVQERAAKLFGGG